MNRRIVMMIAVAMTAFGGLADTETVNGIDWKYTISDGKATLKSYCIN